MMKKTEEQLALKAKFADWAEGEVAPFAGKMDAENRFNEAAWRQLAEMDIWSPLLDDSENELVWWDFSAILEGIASTALDSGFVLTVIAQAAFIRGFTAFADGEWKQKITEELRRGALTATAIAEPHSGTDAMSSRTTFSIGPQGVRANGEKTNIAHASTAKYALIIGKDSATGKLATLLIDCGQEGYQAAALDDKMGMRTIPTASIILKNAKGNFLGKPEEGKQVLQKIGLFARACYVVAYAHLPRPVVRETLEWLSSRESVGQPLLKQQHIQRRLTDIEIDLQTLESMANHALSHVLSNSPEATRAASAAKIAGTNAFHRVMDNLVALKGSVGYQRGAAERLLRDAYGWRNVGGTEEMHRLILKAPH